MSGAYRRFYLYSALSIAVLAACIGIGAVISLLGRFAGLGLTPPDDNDVRLTLSLAVALLLLAIPIGLVHLLMISRALTDPRERIANVRHFYLDFWIFAAFMAILAGGMGLAALTVGIEVKGDRSGALAAALVGIGVAVVGWRWRASTPPPTPRWDLSTAFATMAITMTVAVIQLMIAASAAETLVTGAHPNRPDVAIESTFRQTGAQAAVALVVWAIAARWAWPYRTAVVRLRYLGLGYGVGVGLLVLGIAEAAGAVARFAAGAPASTLGEAWAELAAGILLTTIHGAALRLDRGRNGHPAVTTDRLLLVLPALAGLGTVYGGLVALWAFLTEHVLMPARAHDDPRDHLVTAIAVLAVGLLVYVPSWLAVLRVSDASSAIRRFATFTVVCLALVATVVASAIALFNAFSLVAGATDPGRHEYDALNAAVPALVAAAIFAAYFTLYLHDQRVQRAAAPPAAEVDPLVALLEDVAAGRISAADGAARVRALSL